MVKKVVIVKPGDVVELREKKVKATKATATTATTKKPKKPKKKKDVPAETKKKKRQDKSGTTIKTITIPVKKTATKKKKDTTTATATQERAKRVDRVDAILKGVSKSPSRKQVEEIRQLNASARVFNDVMEKAANTFSKAGVI